MKAKFNKVQNVVVDSDIVFGSEQVLRYLTLVDRRIFIIMHSGIDWRPEYEQELKDIDAEISILRELKERGRRK